MSTQLGALATPHSDATDIGSAILAAGGNAIDAAVAAAIALCVVYPNNVALGSDLVALVRDPNGNITEVNATGGAGSGTTTDELRERHGAQLPMYGVDTINVPGAIRGLEALAAQGAKLPWRDLVTPSVRLARDGIPMSSSVAKGITLLKDTLQADSGCATVFFANGQPIEQGQLFRQPALANTLEALAKNGPDEFYTGEVGAAWLAGIRALGSGITAADLAQYRPAICSPLHADVWGHRVYTSGPNTQGFALLRALSRVQSESSDASAAIDRARLAEQFLVTNAVRDQYLGDPRFGAASGATLMKVEAPTVVTSEYKGRPMGDTVGIAVASADGYAVSLIQSVYFQFGAAILEPRTGILFQNRGTSFSLNPETTNCHAPGKRPAHTLMPVLATQDGHLKYVFATMGGQGQPQIHAQIFASMVEGAHPADAVARARWLVGRQTPADVPTTFTAEAAVHKAILKEVALAGLQVKRLEGLSDVVGHANIVTVSETGSFSAASDPRSDGSHAVVAAPPNRARTAS
ncbi:gamma-glutamyltransferase family protein [Leucobacter aridicollis]|nr:gamma-glutamyltransferase [Leucobacter aridicollis]MBL3680914.1 gamma-glutamyltranspeptidase [Leucobacter aridicollis]